jgi:hypothetical protein
MTVIATGAIRVNGMTAGANGGAGTAMAITVADQAPIRRIPVAMTMPVATQDVIVRIRAEPAHHIPAGMGAAAKGAMAADGMAAIRLSPTTGDRTQAKPDGGHRQCEPCQATVRRRPVLTGCPVPRLAQAATHHPQLRHPAIRRRPPLRLRLPGRRCAVKGQGRYRTETEAMSDPNEVPPLRLPAAFAVMHRQGDT